MSGTSVFGDVDTTDIASLNRILAGLGYLLTHVVINPGVDELKALTFQEKGTVCIAKRS
jgi:hypothetical protein